MERVERAPTEPGHDRWRTVLCLTLLVCLAIVLWEMLPQSWQMIDAWRRDPEQRAITHPVWVNLTPVAITLAEIALFVGALGAAIARREAVSRRWLLIGFAASLGLQIAPRLVPLSWSYRFGPELQERGAAVIATAAPLDAMASVIDLVPLLLAVTVGLLRAGSHHMQRHPERAAGPLVVFAMSLQLALLAALALAAVGPLLPHGWLVPGLLALLAHHALVAIVVGFGTTPTRARVARWLRAGSGVLLALPGWAAVAVGLEDLELAGRHLLAIGGREGFVTMDELPRYAVHFVARACAAALAGNDLIARWRDAVLMPSGKLPNLDFKS